MSTSRKMLDSIKNKCASLKDLAGWPMGSDSQYLSSEPSTSAVEASVPSSEHRPFDSPNTAAHQHNGLREHGHLRHCASCNALEEQLQASKATEQELWKQLNASEVYIQNLRQELTRSGALIGNYHAKVGQVEEEKLQYQHQFEELVKLHLGSLGKGLPLHADDSYFRRELRNLVKDIMQWARNATWGQPQLTQELWRTTPLCQNFVKVVEKKFLNLGGLLVTKSIGNRLRTRLVEAFLCHELLEGIIDSRANPVGLQKASLSTMTDSMICSDEDRQSWKALTVHRLTNNNENFLQSQQLEINELTDSLHEALEPLCSSSPKATKQGLRDIVNRVAHLSLEVSKLPFLLTHNSIDPGNEIDTNYMEDVDIDCEGVGEQGDHEAHCKTTIVLCAPWAKTTFDAEGKYERKFTLLSKGYVSSLH
ncbi:hypothetical protein BDZ91DRAFT_718519 [Kalaharituber pfeilii]|nr:hypothetical protein BDZ91DRAFT_718519 [Kalaharituber pfeilii]